MTEIKAKADPRFFTDLKAWRKREADILAGKAIPTSTDRQLGHSAFQGSPLLDLRQTIDIDIARDQFPAHVLVAMNICRDVPTASNCWAIYVAMNHHSDSGLAYLWHAAIRGHSDAIPLFAISVIQTRHAHNLAGRLMSLALAFGLIIEHGTFHPDDGLEATDIEECRVQGLAKIRAHGESAGKHDVAEAELDEPSGDAVAAGLDAALAELAGTNDSIEAMLEDRAEIKTAMPKRGGGRVVVPAIAAPKQGDSKHKGEILSGVRGIAGRSLPLVGADKLAIAREALFISHPHLHDEIDRILNTQVGRPFSQFRLLLVGPPGAGKTSLATSLAEALGMPSLVYNAGGVADGSFGGTSSQWSTARTSTPLRMTAASGIANGMVIVDEADKIGTGRDNGSLVDVLLAFLEPSSATRYHDPALEMAVDLSAMSYILTANEISDVPVPLRDRVQIVRVPEPGWQHVGALTTRIIADIVREQGLDPRWIAPLAPDELNVLRVGWPGGSLRQLTKMVRLMIDGRERFMGRA